MCRTGDLFTRTWKRSAKPVQKPNFSNLSTHWANGASALATSQTTRQQRKISAKIHKLASSKLRRIWTQINKGGYFLRLVRHDLLVKTTRRFKRLYKYRWGSGEMGITRAVPVAHQPCEHLWRLTRKEHASGIWHGVNLQTSKLVPVLRILKLANFWTLSFCIYHVFNRIQTKRKSRFSSQIQFPMEL